MGEAYITRRGGSNPLNFKVVGGTAEPTNPKENTIWVNTDKEITGYYFSNKGVWNMVEGDLWIDTGEDSAVAFDALKKNGIRVNPTTVKQYVSGAWVDKTAKSYQGGKWVDWWNGELYTPGNEWESVTGGWEAKRSKNNEVLGTVEKTANGLVLSTNNYQLIFCKTVNKIDLSKYSKVTFDLTQVGITGVASCLLGICNDAFDWSWTTSNLSAYQELRKEAGSGKYVLDVSNLSGMFYVFIRPACSNGEYCKVTAEEVRME